MDTKNDGGGVSRGESITGPGVAAVPQAGTWVFVEGKSSA